MEKVTNPLKIVTDPLVLKRLADQGIDKDYVEFFQDYAPRSKGKEHSPYAKFYRDLKSNKRIMVVSGLPMVKPDGTKIKAGWKKQGNRFVSKANLFSAIVQGKQVTLICLSDQPTGVKTGDEVVYQPQLFLNNIEQLPSNPVLLAIDPINENYQENVLEWDYGVCKRRLRIIEGRIHGYWVFPANPSGEVRIKYNQTGNFRLKLGQFKVNEDEEIIPQSVFDEAEYPFEVSDSATFYPDPDVENTSVDGYVEHATGGSSGVTWATLRTSAGTNSLDDAFYSFSIYIYADIQDVAEEDWRRLSRGIVLFDTSGLPDNADISAATLSLYGLTKADLINATPDINVYSADPFSNTGLQADDFADLGSTPFCDTPVTYANWKITDPFWNDFVFNGAGLAAISLTSITKLGLRNASYDVSGTIPNWVENKSAHLRNYTAEQGNGYKPKLVVTYTIPVTQNTGGASMSIAGTMGRMVAKSLGGASMSIAGTMGRMIAKSLGGASMSIAGALAAALRRVVAVGQGAVTIAGYINVTATKTLRPDAVGDETNIDTQIPSSGAHWDKVDEAVHDGNTTRISTGKPAYERDLFNIAAHGRSGTETINSVTVYIVGKSATPNGDPDKQVSCKIVIKTGGTVYEGAAFELEWATYASYNKQWVNNPSTSSPWTWAEIRALQAGISMRSSNDSGIPDDDISVCTQVYVEVEYLRSLIPRAIVGGASMSIAGAFQLVISEWIALTLKRRTLSFRLKPRTISLTLRNRSLNLTLPRR